MKLWLDDERDPPDDSWIVARNVKEAILLADMAHYNNAFDFASLDHDLGDMHNGTVFVRWMIDQDIWPTKGMQIHSINPVGAKNMKDAIDSHGPYATPVPWRPAFK